MKKNKLLPKLPLALYGFLLLLLGHNAFSQTMNPTISVSVCPPNTIEKNYEINYNNMGGRTIVLHKDIWDNPTIRLCVENAIKIWRQQTQINIAISPIPKPEKEWVYPKDDINYGDAGKVLIRFNEDMLPGGYGAAGTVFIDESVVLPGDGPQLLKGASYIDLNKLYLTGSLIHTNYNSKTEFQAVVMHELGHILGLGHTPPIIKPNPINPNKNDILPCTDCIMSNTEGQVRMCTHEIGLVHHMVHVKSKNIGDLELPLKLPTIPINPNFATFDGRKISIHVKDFANNLKRVTVVNQGLYMPDLVKVKINGTYIDQMQGINFEKASVIPDNYKQANFKYTFLPDQCYVIEAEAYVGGAIVDVATHTINGNVCNNAPPAIHCPIPNALLAPNYANYTLYFSDNCATGNGYIVDYRVKGQPNTQISTNAGNFFCGNIPVSLAPCETYEFRIRFLCKDGKISVSNWIEVKPKLPPALESPASSNQNSMTFLYNCAPNEGYIVEYRTLDAPNNIGYSNNNTFKCGLVTIPAEPCKTNQFRIRFRCLNGKEMTSDWKDWQTSASIPAALQMPVQVTSNAMTFDYNCQNGEGYIVEYRRSDFPSNVFYSNNNSFACGSQTVGLTPCENHQFRIRFRCANGGEVLGNWTNITATSAIPAELSQPSEVTAVSMTFSYNCKTGEGYVVEYRLVENPDNILKTNNGNFSCGNLQISLTPCKEHEFRIKFRCAGGKEIYSDWKKVNPPSAVPNQLLLPISSTAQSMSFSYNCNPGEGYIIELRQKNNPGNVTFSNNNMFGCGNQTVSFQPCISYEYRIRFRCASGGETYSQWQPYDPPNTIPAQLQNPTSVTANTATFNYNCQSGEGYIIEYRQVGSNNIMYSHANIFTCGSVSINLTPCLQHEYRIKFRCALGAQVLSDWKPINQPAAALPTELQAPLSVTHNAMNFDYSCKNSNEGYLVEYRQTATPSNIQVIENGSYVCGFYSISLTPCVAHQYRVKYKCANGQIITGEWKNLSEQLQSACCSTPSGVSVSSVTATSAKISWQGAAGVNEYELSYRVAGGSWQTQIVLTTELTLTGLNPSTLYEYRLRVKCDSNSEGPYSPIGTFTTPILNCSIPAALNAPISGTANSITFQYNCQSGSGEGYFIEYRQKGNPGPSLFTNFGNFACQSGPWPIGLTPCVAHEYRVHFRCASGQVVVGDWKDAVEQAQTGCSCPPPNGVTVDVITSNSVKISWQSVANANLYEVSYRIVGNVNWQTKNVAGPKKEVTLNGLNPNAVYEYRIRSRCSNLWGPHSSTATFSSNNCQIPSALSSPISGTSNSITFQYNC